MTASRDAAVELAQAIQLLDAIGAALLDKRVGHPRFDVRQLAAYTGVLAQINANHLRTDYPADGKFWAAHIADLVDQLAAAAEADTTTEVTS